MRRFDEGIAFARDFVHEERGEMVALRVSVDFLRRAIARGAP